MEPKTWAVGEVSREVNKFDAISSDAPLGGGVLELGITKQLLDQNNGVPAST